LIRYCLTQAAQTAVDRSKDWVALAEKVGLENGIDFSVIRFVTDESDLTTKARALDNIERKLLEDRINRLDAFKKMAASLTSYLRRQLKQSLATKVGS
ncbi:MAG: hypothetical protein KJ814_03660, partial [Proteobacteria bacterium]|nr:hypothetical protein [Pseudomonadota bacterium]